MITGGGQRHSMKIRQSVVARGDVANVITGYAEVVV